MKTDKTIKVLLGIIVINLTLITLNELSLFPKAFATETSLNAHNNINYGLVPINEDGTISVKIEDTDVLDINIHSFKGKDFFEAVPVFVMNQ